MDLEENPSESIQENMQSIMQTAASLGNHLAGIPPTKILTPQQGDFKNSLIRLNEYLTETSNLQAEPSVYTSALVFCLKGFFSSIIEEYNQNLDNTSQNNE